MARSLNCDMCGKELDEIKAKIFISPSAKKADYTAHADIGACCLPELNRRVKFTRRVEGAKASEA